MDDISVFINDVKFNFRVGVIFEYNDSVIIEKGNSVNYGVVPGGRVKTLEDTKASLIREIQEEMHFDISKKDIILQDIIENFFEEKGVKFHELFFVYRIKLDESDELVHRSKEELINYDSESNYYEFIALKDIEKEDIKPVVMKNLFNDKKFNTYIVRNK